MSVAAYHDAIASEYDSLLAKERENEQIRAAFLQFVADRVSPGACILDLGCGTGTDARWYAARGYRVLAHDPSLGMMEAARVKCADEIADGSITLLYGQIGAILAQSQTLPIPAAVTANFAVLNMVEHSHALFAQLAEWLLPEGWVLASILNPWYARDLRSPRWWLPLLRGSRTGYVRMPGTVVPSYRHFVSHLVASAAPGFEPAAIFGCNSGARPGFRDKYVFVALRRVSPSGR